MNNNQLNKALEIVRRTGDKMLVMDQETDKVFALMDLDEYEFLLDHDSESIENYDEEEMLNKLDRDLKNWRHHHDDEDEEDFNDIFENNSTVDFEDLDDSENLSTEEVGFDNLKKLDEMPNFKDEESDSEEDWIEEPVSLNENLNFIEKDLPTEDVEQKPDPINIIPLDKDSGQPMNILKEEDLDDLPEDDPEEEDKFYLEPVE